ncbi:MAG TPA: pyroglutamyl-peptidase I [Xanthobacteraceae bacterium]|nr:pyroglutamyl-peptidase I [Xanthobacteraceae bacterium]
MPITLLITGFGPFPGARENPSGLLAQRLARRRRPAFAGVHRVAHVFPTSYAALARELPALLAKHRPDALLMFGLAPRARHLRIETRARNRLSPILPDAERRKPSALRLAAAGPDVLPVRAPVPRLLSAARAAGVRASLSHDAGRYLCNALLWRALETRAQYGTPRIAAFVHVPHPQRLALPALVRAGEAIMREILAAARRTG